ncbi:MAG TPA: hypothetical protein VHM30_19600, partial [Gemmatimonadaceae bacterium]|nr:hypothetical protein [Gemmatimonadaceae bacterium]
MTTVAAQRRAVPRGAERMLRLVVVVAALGPVVYGGSPGSVVPDGVRIQSGLLWILCWAPAFVYLGQSPERRAPIP